MIEKITTWIKTNAVALVILVLMLVGGNQLTSFGAAGDINTQSVWFVKGLTAGNPKVSVIDSSGNVVGPVAAVGGVSSTGDGTISGGTLNVTTSNTATSTIIGGCWQFYATSTATANKYQASTTPGIMYSSYGTCPNL